jgi:hypothetical protein
MIACLQGIVNQPSHSSYKIVIMVYTVLLSMFNLIYTRNGRYDSYR